MRRFFKFTIPSIISMWVFALYTMVDGFFVSHFIGELEFSAVNLSMPVVTTFFAFGILFSIGTQSRVGYALGQGDLPRAQEIVSTSVITLTGAGILYVLALWIFQTPLAQLLGADQVLQPLVISYLSGILPFGLFFMLTYQLEVLVKVDGFPQTTTLSVTTAALTNLVLDYLFIVPLQLGLFGAGLATGLAQLVSSSLMLTHFYRKRGRLTLSWRFNKKHLKSILGLGLGDALAEMAIGYTVYLFNTVLYQQFGETGLVVYSVVSYVFIFAQVTMTGVAQGLAPLFSYDYGQKNYQTISRTIRGGVLFVLGISILFWSLAQLASFPLVCLFLSPESKLVPIAQNALGRYAYGYIFIGMNTLLMTLFASLGKGKRATLLSILRTPVMISLVMFIYSQLSKGATIWFVLTVSEALAFIPGLFWFRREVVKPLRSIEEKSE